MRKFFLILLFITPLTTSANYFNDFDDLLKTYFGGHLVITSPWPIEGGYSKPKYPRAGDKYFDENSAFINSGTFLTEPVFNVYAGTGLSTSPNPMGYLTHWTDSFVRLCSGSSAYRKMPLYGTPDSWVNYTDMFNGGVKRSIKSFIVNQNVPFRFSAKKHGGLSKRLKDSVYYWSFGDGMRTFNKRKDVNGVTHTYPFRGSYSVSSMVYSKGFNFLIQIGSSNGGDLKLDYSKMYKGLYIRGDDYLEGCDYADVTVVKNDAPKASISAFKTSSSHRRTTYTFSADNSSDANGNPLTYTWRSRNTTRTGKRVSFSFNNPEGPRTLYYTVSLTVSDGDKSNTTTRRISTKRYQYSGGSGGRHEP